MIWRWTSDGWSRHQQNCRETIQKLAQFGQQQQEELLSRQEQIRHAHDDLMKNSESILEAQVFFYHQSHKLFSWRFLRKLWFAYCVCRKSSELSRRASSRRWTSSTSSTTLFLWSPVSSRPSSSTAASHSSSTCSPAPSRPSPLEATSTSVRFFGLQHKHCQHSERQKLFWIFFSEHVHLFHVRLLHHAKLRTFRKTETLFFWTCSSVAC